MKLELKRISRESVPFALEKADRYRLLNEPGLAESICLDVLDVEPDNQRAVVTLLLALTDQLAVGSSRTLRRAQELLPSLQGGYERAYYRGIICERMARAALAREGFGAGPLAWSWLTEAMEAFASAEAHAPPGQEDAKLRWNACARTLRDNPHVRPAPQDEQDPLLE